MSQRIVNRLCLTISKIALRNRSLSFISSTPITTTRPGICETKTITLADYSAKTDKKQPTASSMGLFSKPADQKSDSLHGLKVKELTRELITFYDAISEGIRPLRHDFATVSAQKHLAYLEQHGRSTAFYTWLVERSHDAIQREAFASRLPKHLAPAQEDQLHRNFYQKIAQFNAPISARLEQEQEQATSPPCSLL